MKIDDRVTSRAIYAASAVSSKTLSAWEARGFLTNRAGDRYLPAPRHGAALEYTVLDVVVLRLARELTELGMSVREAVSEAHDHRPLIAATLAGRSAAPLFLFWWEERVSPWTTSRSTLTGSMTTVEAELRHHPGACGRFVDLTGLCEAVVASLDDVTGAHDGA
jgi:hypothetical protein